MNAEITMTTATRASIVPAQKKAQEKPTMHTPVSLAMKLWAVMRGISVISISVLIFALAAMASLSSRLFLPVRR